MMCYFCNPTSLYREILFMLFLFFHVHNNILENISLFQCTGYTENICQINLLFWTTPSWYVKIPRLFWELMSIIISQSKHNRCVNVFSFPFGQQFHFLAQLLSSASLFLWVPTMSPSSLAAPIRSSLFCYGPWLYSFSPTPIFIWIFLLCFCTIALPCMLAPPYKGSEIFICLEEKIKLPDHRYL